MNADIEQAKAQHLSAALTRLESLAEVNSRTVRVVGHPDPGHVEVMYLDTPYNPRSVVPVDELGYGDQPSPAAVAREQAALAEFAAWLREDRRLEIAADERDNPWADEDDEDDD